MVACAQAAAGIVTVNASVSRVSTTRRILVLQVDDCGALTGFAATAVCRRALRGAPTEGDGFAQVTLAGTGPVASNAPCQRAPTRRECPVWQGQVGPPPQWCLEADSILHASSDRREWR